MSIFIRLFGNPNQETDGLTTLEMLNETLKMLANDKKELFKKVARELEKAKQFSTLRDRRGALWCLKRKKLYERQIEQLGNCQLCIHEQTMKLLEIKEKALLKKAAAEVERARDSTISKNRREAIKCLKSKRLYERQIEQLGNFQMRIHDQNIMLESEMALTKTVAALRTGAAAIKQKVKNVDDVDKTMDEINKQTENMRQMQKELSTLIGGAADFIEDELEAELFELEEQLLQPVKTAIAAPVQVSAGHQSAGHSAWLYVLLIVPVLVLVIRR